MTDLWQAFNFSPKSSVPGWAPAQWNSLKPLLHSACPQPIQPSPALPLIADTVINGQNKLKTGIKSHLPPFVCSLSFRGFQQLICWKFYCYQVNTLFCGTLRVKDAAMQTNNGCYAINLPPNLTHALRV